jgi:hypothetical protein
LGRRRREIPGCEVSQVGPRRDYEPVHGVTIVEGFRHHEFQFGEKLQPSCHTLAANSQTRALGPRRRRPDGPRRRSARCVASGTQAGLRTGARRHDRRGVPPSRVSIRREAAASCTCSPTQTRSSTVLPYSRRKLANSCSRTTKTPGRVRSASDDDDDPPSSSS